MTMRTWLSTLWDRLREEWGYASIINAQHAAGSANPTLDANRELFIRAEYLERFRDKATEAYMRHGTSLEESAKQFIKDWLSTKTSALDTQTTAAVRGIIRDMGEDEAFHPEAYRKYRAEMQNKVANAVAFANRLDGPSGQSKYVTRVLRGKA